MLRNFQQKKFKYSWNPHLCELHSPEDLHFLPEDLGQVALHIARLQRKVCVQARASGPATTLAVICR